MTQLPYIVWVGGRHGFSGGMGIDWMENQIEDNEFKQSHLLLHKWHHVWDNKAMCGEYSAQSRFEWLRINKSLSPSQAIQTVISEFPLSFLHNFYQWNPTLPLTQSGQTYTAEERMNWLINHDGKTKKQAQIYLIENFPREFKRNPILYLSYTSPVSMNAQKMVWEENFSNGLTNWKILKKPKGWRNNEAQEYTDSKDNVEILGTGTLGITATYKDDCFKSGRLVSNLSWKYGRFEIRAKMPDAVGTWPALWMLPKGKFEWPNDGEIDICEHVGHEFGEIHGTVHTENFNHLKNTQVGGTCLVDVENWHVYSVNWTENEILFFVDGHCYFGFKKEEEGGRGAWPFDREFCLILNLAVGGNWGGQKGIAKEAYPQTMQIDWIRVYQ